MPPTLKDTQINSAQDEFVVKKYHVSRFRSQFSNVRSDGYLHLTNKRVIFQAIAEDSVIHSEIPIENVAGINLYHGEYRDWLRLLIFIVLIGLTSGLVITFSAALSFMDNDAIIWGIGFLLLSLALGSSSYVAKNVFSSNEPFINIGILGQGLIAACATLVFLTISSSNPIALLLAMPSLLLTISCMRSIPRKYSMSLAIVSKGGSSTPIMIAGANSSGMVFSAAAQAFEAEPGNDAEKLIKELGAIIHDIQTLGAYGVDRWTGQGQGQTQQNDNFRWNTTE
jgi:hypothetical protein